MEKYNPGGSFAKEQIKQAQKKNAALEEEIEKESEQLLSHFKTLQKLLYQRKKKPPSTVADDPVMIAFYKLMNKAGVEKFAAYFVNSYEIGIALDHPSAWRIEMSMTIPYDAFNLFPSGLTVLGQSEEEPSEVPTRFTGFFHSGDEV